MHECIIRVSDILLVWLYNNNTYVLKIISIRFLCKIKQLAKIEKIPILLHSIELLHPLDVMRSTRYKYSCFNAVLSILSENFRCHDQYESNRLQSTACSLTTHTIFFFFWTITFCLHFYFVLFIIGFRA